jgi:branched-chain amino acid transport system substrate-binding protein
MRHSLVRMLSLVCVVCLTAVLLAMYGCSKPETSEKGVTSPKAAKGGAAQETPAGNPIKVGAIFSVTGPGAPLGTPEKETAEMVLDQINKAGGIGGRQLQLIIEDDGTEESKAVMAAKKLIEEDKVCAIVGPTMSGTSLAIIPDCEKAEVPLISCAASVKITQPAKKWVFSTAQNDVLAVQRILVYLQAQKIKKVAIICDGNAFGQSGAEQLRAQLPAAGVAIVDEEKYATKDADMTAQLTKIKAKAPEAIICWGTSPGPAVIAKGVKSLGIKGKLIMSHGVANKAFIEQAGDAAEGIILPAGKLLVRQELAAGDPQKAALDAYATDFEKAAGKPANTFGGHAYDALQILRTALGTAGDDKAKLRDAIEATKGYTGIGGVFNFSATDHNGLTKDAFTLVQIKSGAWTQAK